MGCKFQRTDSKPEIESEVFSRGVSRRQSTTAPHCLSSEGSENFKQRISEWRDSRRNIRLRMGGAQNNKITCLGFRCSIVDENLD